MIFKKDKSIYTKLANKYNLPYQVVEVICNHPFRFANRVIADDNDERVLMFGYLFKIKLKKKYEGRKANKQENKDKLSKLKLWYSLLMVLHLCMVVRNS